MTYDTVSQAAEWYWQGRQAYLHGKPRDPPPDDRNGVWLAGYAEAARADLRRTMMEVTAPR